MYTITEQERKVIRKNHLTEAEYSIKKAHLACQKGCSLAALSELNESDKKIISSLGVNEQDFMSTRLEMLAEEVILGI